MKKEYTDKVALLVETIPFIAKEPCFALKGGTAINLFYRDMPRLSVDIDLTYINFDDRNTAYMNINEALARIASTLTHNGFSAIIQGNGEEKKVIVSNRVASIKIEPNYTLRGCAYKPDLRSICESAEREYGFAEIQIISAAELYGGKICAALDRQHPRDLFDIQEILAFAEKEKNLMHGFLAMLLGHNRPVHELLHPKMKDQSEVFEKEFAGMTDTEFSYEDHVRLFGELVQFVQNGIAPYKNFLLDFVALNPDFQSLGIPNVDRLPAIRWKLQNLEKLKKSNPDKFIEQHEKLLQLFL
jgi:Domain of unknown function (DUF1814).